MNGITATRETLGLVHEYLEGAFGDSDLDTITKTFEGATVGPIGAIYLHALSSEDWAIQTLIQGKPKIVDTGDWYTRFGLEAPKQGQEANWSQANADLTSYNQYATAVFKATEDWLASATDADLDKQITWHDGSQKSAGWVLADVIHSHLAFHAGEIAALKGLMGLKGLPW